MRDVYIPISIKLLRFGLTIVCMSAILLSACNPYHAVSSLPMPDRECATPQSWHGLIPGQSSQSDVVKNLGIPSENVVITVGEQEYNAYTYSVLSGQVSDFARDRVFIGKDNKVAWIEAIVADRSGNFQSAKDIINELGTVVDTIYMLDDYVPNKFIPFGRAYAALIYAWANCGVALVVSNGCAPIEGIKVTCSNWSQPEITVPAGMTTRYPNPFPGEADLYRARVDAVIFMKVLFPPTTYQGFKDTLMFQLPRYDWGKYLNEAVKRQN